MRWSHKIKLTPPKGKKSENPKYCTPGQQEYRITNDGALWRIYAWKGGLAPQCLRGGHTSRQKAEEILIRHLRSLEVNGSRAVYPGSNSKKLVR